MSWEQAKKEILESLLGGELKGTLRGGYLMTLLDMVHDNEHPDKYMEMYLVESAKGPEHDKSIMWALKEFKGIGEIWLKR